MKLSDKFEEKVNETKNTPRQFTPHAHVVPIGVVRGIIRRLRDLEEMCISEFGYLPGKPATKEHWSYEKLYNL